MTTAFVPLTSKLGPEAESSKSSASIVSGRPFNPLGEKQLLPKSPTAAASSVPQSRACQEGPPNVTAHRENGQITHLRVECRCGEVIELECLY